MLCTRVASGTIGRHGLTSVDNRIFPLVSTTATSHSAPGRSVVSQSMMTAVPGWSMVRAQVTAWSERRSQGGASAVVIIGDSSRQAVLVVVLKYSRSHRHQRYAPLLWRLTTNLQGPRGYPSRPS